MDDLDETAQAAEREKEELQRVKERLRFDVSLQTREFEIDLFWKRSLFFWGFISAAFISYAAMMRWDTRIIVACFGIVCSFSWTLVNRGSKHWQEVWETKLERYELPVIGEFFGQTEQPQNNRGAWLRGRKFSVSKLAIALRDYVFLIWVVIVLREFLSLWLPSFFPSRLITRLVSSLLILASLVYLFVVYRVGRTSPRPHPESVL